MVSFSQKKTAVKGIILDQENFLISYASVGIINKNIGTTSTDEGSFYLMVTDQEMNDTLQISSIGYDTYKVRIKDFISQKSHKVILKEKTIELSEISLVSTEYYVKKALKNLKNNTVRKKHELKILYRRWSVEDDICRFYIEHFMNVIDRGPSSYISKYSIQESRKSSEYRFIKNSQNRHAIEYMEINNPLRDGMFLNDYEWKKIENSSYDGEDVLVAEGSNNGINTIKLYIGYDSYKIYRLEIIRSPPKVGKYLNAIYLYKKNKEGKLYLSYHNREWGGSAKTPKSVKRLHALKNKSTKEFTPVAYRHEVFVLEVEEDEKKFETYKAIEKMDMTLYEIPYNENFWNSISLPPETSFYKKNISELESLFNVPIATQFKYSNR
tara:strand:+ start:1999 stop:3144 length:1146 start_codon:yes stop_codon:yes gene_type:complete